MRSSPHQIWLCYWLCCFTLLAIVEASDFLRSPIYTISNVNYQSGTNYPIIPDVTGCTFCFLSAVQVSPATIHTYYNSLCQVDVVNGYWSAEMDDGDGQVSCKIYCIYCLDSNSTISPPATISNNKPTSSSTNATTIPTPPNDQFSYATSPISGVSDDSSRSIWSIVITPSFVLVLVMFLLTNF